MQNTNSDQPIPVSMDSMTGERPFRLEDKGNYLKLTLHGYFTGIDENTKIVEDLYESSKTHSMVEVWVNSEGGFVPLMIEIIEALKQFETVITLCNSSAFSCGAMVWAFGDIRVTSAYASIGFHRESYGFYGKTDQHSDLLEHQKKIYPLLLEETCGHILTEKEKEKAKVTELYFNGMDMIDNDYAISFDQYKSGDCQMSSRLNPIGTVFTDLEKGTLVMIDENGVGRHISPIDEYSPYEFMAYDYMLSNEVRVKYDHNESFVFEKKADFEKMIDRFYEWLETNSDHTTQEEGEDLPEAYSPNYPEKGEK